MAEIEFSLRTTYGTKSGSHSGNDYFEHWSFTDFVDKLINQNDDIQIFSIDLSIEIDTDCNTNWRDSELVNITQHLLKKFKHYQYLEEINMFCNPPNDADETLDALRLFIEKIKTLKSITLNGQMTDIYDKSLIKSIILSNNNKLYNVHIDGIGLCYQINTSLNNLPMLCHGDMIMDENEDDDEDQNFVPSLLYQKAYRLNSYYSTLFNTIYEMNVLTNDIIQIIIEQYIKDDIIISVDCSCLSCIYEPDNEWKTYAQYLNDKNQAINVNYDDEEYQLNIQF